MTTQTTCRDCHGELTGIDMFRCTECAMAYRVALRTTPGVFKARFQSTCPACNRPLAKGDNALMQAGKAIHFGCAYRANRPAQARCPLYTAEDGCPLHGETCRA